MKLVFDIEADGLYQEATRIWCIVTKDIDTGESKQYYGRGLEQGISSINSADTLIGHNIIAYDLPLLDKLGFLEDKKREIVDTFTLSCLLNPDRGGHGLDAWGKRLNRYKPAHEDWSQFSEEMLHRCTEDVEINHLVYKALQKEIEK